jgi:hypothetical protein
VILPGELHHAKLLAGLLHTPMLSATSKGRCSRPTSSAETNGSASPSPASNTARSSAGAPSHPAAARTKYGPARLVVRAVDPVPVLVRLRRRVPEVVHRDLAAREHARARRREARTWTHCATCFPLCARSATSVRPYFASSQVGPGGSSARAQGAAASSASASAPKWASMVTGRGGGGAR